MAARRPSSASIATADATRSNENNTNIFGDEFAEDYAESIHTTDPRGEDPFRDPVGKYSTSLSSERQAFLQTAIGRHTSIGSRSSIRKSSLPNTSMTEETPNHEEAGELTFATTNDAPRRALSIASTSSAMPDPSSQSGPSHPYTMYPQNFALSRSASIATSHGRPAISAQHRGPTHPYAMYPQSTSGSGDTNSDTTTRSQTIPLGFPGHVAGFRRIGPEGEEQDIVGIEGHAEQLPPYSRYPETYDNKSAAVGLLSATTPEPGPSSRQEAPVEMSERPRQDEVQRHVSEESIPPTSAAPAATAATAASAATAPIHPPISEKQPEPRWREKNFKGKLKHKIFGKLRVWWILLFLAVVIVIATVCGGVIGSFIARGKPVFHQNNPNLAAGSHSTYGSGLVSTAATAQTTVVVTTTTQYTRYVDATPIATPASLSSLPTGTFAVTFATPSVYSSSCLSDDVQQVAWSCQFPSGQSTFALDVDWDSSGPAVTMFSVENPTGNNTDYGTQPPSFTQAPLSLVLDLENSTYGPGYQFSSIYNKLVILPGNSLSFNSRAKRQAPGSDPTCTSSLPPPPPPPPFFTPLPWWATKKRIQPTDQPWFCWFNQTYIDGFIYVDTPENTPVSPSSSVLTSSWTTLQTSTISSASTPPDYTTSRTTTIPSVDIAKRQTTTQPVATSSYYPKTVKVEERRMQGQASEAICTQMSKSPDGSGYIPVVSAGAPVTLALNETDPTPNYVTGTGKRDTSSWNYPSGCYCQWST